MKKAKYYLQLKSRLTILFLFSIIINLVTGIHVYAGKAAKKQAVVYTLNCPAGTDLCSPFPFPINLIVSPAGATNYDFYGISLFGPLLIQSGPSNTYQTNDSPQSVYCMVTDASGTQSTNVLDMKTLNPVHMAVQSNVSGNPVCAGAQFSIFPAIWNSYQWYRNGVAIPGATSSAYYGTQTGHYNYMVSNNCGTDSAMNGVYISVDLQLPASVSLTITPAAPCVGQSLTLIAPAVAGCNYKWYRQYSDAGYTNFTSGIDKDTITTMGSSTLRYSVSLQNACGTRSTQFIPVTWTQAINSTFTASGPLQFCPGNSVTFTAAQNAGWNYQWKKNGVIIGGAASHNYTANTSGSYNLLITDPNGCTNTFTKDVSASGPNASALGTTPFCTNSQEYVYTPEGAGFTYKWYKNGTLIPGATNDSLPVDSVTNGSFYVIVNSSCGADTSSAAQYNFYGPPAAVISANDPLNFCSGDSAGLNANYGINYGYSWNKNGTKIPGSEFINYEAKSTGNYTATVVNTFGCISISAGVSVTANSLPSALITPGGSTTFCSGGGVVLNAVVTANRTYQWKKNNANISGAALSSYTANTSGNYKVTVTNTTTGCSKTTTVATVITVNPLPAATVTPQGPTTFCAGGSVVLKANSGTGLTYKWKKNGAFITGATSINYTATTAGTYKVQVTKNTGCSKTSAGVVVTVPCKLAGSESESEDESVRMDSFGESEFVKIFPNPSTGAFTIQFSEQPFEPVQIKLTDMFGNVFESLEVKEQKVLLNQTGLASGIYFLEARNENGIRVKKIIITR